jgi:hypothetical protein
MKQPMWAGWAGLSCLVLTAAPTFAVARMIAPAPIPQRVALADAVVVGKVTAFSDKLVSARPPFGGNKVDYQIAIVRIDDALLGAKDAKEIKVGFLPPAAIPVPGPGPLRIMRRYPQFVLSLDQEACLILTKHPDEDFYVGQNYYDLINKKGNASFDREVDEVKRCAKLLADPTAGLKAKNADDRFLTAAMLVTRYRTPKGGAPGKTEAIDVEQSQQILLALANADWNAKAAKPGFQMNPQTLFFQLGLTAKDGWMPPKDFNKIADEAKRWLKDNAEKYRIERFVADKGDK